MKRKTSLLINLALIIALFFPTSVKAVISVELQIVYSIVIGVLFFLLFFNSRKTINLKLMLCAISINILILYFTLLTSFNDYSFGAYIPYLLLTTLFILDLSNYKISHKNRILFIIVNIINIFLGTVILLENNTFWNFIIDNYSAGYESLVESMLYRGKPVLTFGSHSIAAFFIYLFFYLNYKEYQITKRKTNLLFIIAYIILLFKLNSVTSFIFLFLSVIQIIIVLFSKRNILLKTLMIVVCLLFISNNLYFLQNIIAIFSEKGHGLIGRYSSDGVLSANINYIVNNIFKPIGLGYDPSLYFTDSGILLNILRGSLLLPILLYGGLIIFLLTNINNRKVAIFLFIIIVGFELGYSILTYTRMICFLPFLVVYLNSLEEYQF